MKTSAYRLALAVALSWVSSVSFAAGAFADEDHAYLDRPYRNPHPPVELDLTLPHGRFPEPPESPLAAHSDVEALIARQTPVRMQGQRGTCSIFASTAMLESMLVIKHGAPLSTDLSEEWLEYVIARTHADDGSGSTANFEAFANYGDTDEATMPYIGETWDSVGSSDLSQQRCGNVPANLQKGCLLSHWDPRFLTTTDAWLQQNQPEFFAARQSAFRMRDTQLASLRGQTQFLLPTTADIKAALASGIPVTVDLEFYYGAWNHRLAQNIGITRDMDHWYKGIIGYPEEGSIDRRDSRDSSKIEVAGHSVLIVGYDDDVEVTTSQQMTDGSVQEFTYKGVYYFKNSWSTDNFGKDFELNGVPHPGYGMITQKYANEFGTFYQLPLR